MLPMVSKLAITNFSFVVKFLEASGNDQNAALFVCFILYEIENSKELIAVRQQFVSSILFLWTQTS
jgi:hypothetical protein